ncbi:MAG: hypothetical protein ABI222_14615 [Opitutaceae bacterium]
MKSRLGLFISLLAFILLAACAGPAPKQVSVVAPSVRPASPAVAVKPAPKFYVVTFDAQGLPHDRTGAVVNRERVIALVAKGDIDQHTGIRIEVPKDLTDHDQSIAAFARGQEVAKIFSLLNFDAVVVALAN